MLKFIKEIKREEGEGLKAISNEKEKTFVLVVICVLVALLSVSVVAEHATNPENYEKTIQSIDEKKATVMGVTATAAAVSTGLAAIPGDATTPIADQIMDLSGYLLIVICALVLEKALLTICGFLAFKIFIPAACALIVLSFFIKRPVLKVLGMKCAVFALVIATIIPFSVKISDMIYATNEIEVEDLVTESEEAEETEEPAWWEKIINKVKETKVDAAEKTKEILNKFIDTIALFLIAYCAIPVLIFLTVIWFVKFLFHITIPMPQKGNSKKDKELLE